MFYVNNYINWNQLKQIYNPNYVKKDVQKTDVIAHKLRSTLTKVINSRLKVVRNEI